ncbi:hypothetical protein LV84_01451 [Algoriphagus ratkowskyi]|uniref:Phage abortive infection protein n=2 Tax=Algoriphagus ratkowskyi TaxID=57028 RepID=A0A2W7RSE9_9BACT|nr:hypothetical protein [Algoriphagus ratkowskyi]PZX58247.1 hypothetical protein LV84_01451 [Algoriphagus ratkowskyi]TXD77873.1 hypothetical protein ESW18_10945 [Algoriphagus ratkowskyi]
MSIRLFKISFIIMIVFIILNIGIFLYYFHDQVVSRNISDWANFSSYISGTTSVIISIMTLLVTICIAKALSNLDEKRHIANIEYEKKRFTRDLREKKYAEVSENLNSFWLAIRNKNGGADELYIIRTRFFLFAKYKDHLFPNLNRNDLKPIDDILVEILEKMDKNLGTDNPENLGLVEKFQKEVNSFHKIMQEYITTQ